MVPGCSTFLAFRAAEEGEGQHSPALRSQKQGWGVKTLEGVDMRENRAPECASLHPCRAFLSFTTPQTSLPALTPDEEVVRIDAVREDRERHEDAHDQGCRGYKGRVRAQLT